MPRFVLIDASLTGPGGHHLDYAEQVLKAAEEQGLESLLVAHRGFRGSNEVARWLVGPGYRLDYWGGQKLNGAPAVRRGRLEQARLQLLAGIVDQSPRSVRVVVRAVRQVRRARIFVEDTVRLFHQLGLCPADTVFMPNVSDADLLGLGWYLSAQPSAREMSWHLLLRRDPPTRESELGLARSLRRSLARLARYSRVYFYSDTEHLVRKYSAVGCVDFASVPIPVDPRMRPMARAARSPLVVGYLGDARQEKGFQQLPGLVRRVNAAAPDAPRIKLLAQCYGADADVSLSRARAQLVAFPSNQVSLIDAALDSSSYAALLRSLDILLVPYDPDQYSQRSSGVFAEGVCAGVPTLVPAGTWMADQLQPALTEWHLELERRAHVSVASADVVSIAPDASFMISPGATHVLVKVAWPEGTPAGSRARVRVELLTAAWVRIGEEQAVVGAVSDPGCTILVRVGREVARGRLSIRPLAETRSTPRLRGLECLVLTEPTPVGAVGAVYGRHDHMADALLELVVHYSHYRATATEFSRRISDYHQPSNLVSSLVRRAAASC